MCLREATPADYEKYDIRGVPALILSPRKRYGWGKEMQGIGQIQIKYFSINGYN